MSDLLTVMRDHGHHIMGAINYSEIKPQRFKSVHKPNGNPDIFVILHGDKGATFGDWHDRESWVLWWKDKDYKPTIYDRQSHERQMSIHKEEQAIERKNAIKTVKSIWDNASEANPDHPYMIKKQLWRPLYLRQIDDKLIVPIYDRYRETQSIQYIYPNGFKHTHAGTTYKDGHLLLGEDVTETTYICEGWATGATIYEARGDSVIVCFTASNLLDVAIMFKRKYIQTLFYICADNDCYNDKNIGLECAKQAAQHTGSSLLIPRFDHLIHDKKPTDFNDLMCIAGIEEVENQLLRA